MLSLRRLVVLLVFASSSAMALDGKIPLDQLHHDIWTGKDGAPAQVSSMAQTADGWLWIGSVDGFYRFDGMRFRRFEALNGETAPKRPVTALTALRDGDLLIGYLFGGLSRLHGGHIMHYPALVGNAPIGPVTSATTDERGQLWVATTSALLQLRGGAWRDVGPELGLPAGEVSNVVADQYGQVWVAVGHALYVMPAGAQRFRQVQRQDVHTVNLIESPDGRLWQDLHDRLIPVPGQHRGPLMPRPAWLAQSQGQENGLFDRDGNFWSLACPVGVCRTAGVGAMPGRQMAPNAGPRDRLDQPWQLSSLTGNILFEDRDGSIWIGTQAGVERFRHNRLAPVALAGGGRTFKLARDHFGQVLALSLPSGRVWRLRADGAQAIDEGFPPGNVGAIGNARDGALLLARPNGLEVRYPNRSERIAYPSNPADPAGPVDVSRVFDDGDGLWVRIARRGHFRFAGGKWTSEVDLGLPPGSFVGEAGARSGTLWLGYDNGAIVYFDHGKVTRYPQSLENDIGPITHLHVLGDEVVAGGAGGLAVLRGGAFQRLAAADADVLAGVSGTVVGANGDRWLNGSKGVVYVKAADWQAAAGAPGVPLKYILYGVLDGYPGFADTSTRRPSALGGVDGQLWFVGATGMARLDTTTSYPAPHAPSVVVETLVARGERHLDFSKPVRLAPGTTSFRIEFTALSYSMPEMVRFRYRLEGVDADWQDSGNRRAVSYTNVGPGDYRFRIAAVNELGQWNARDTSIDVTILPTFAQTPLFYGLCALAAAGALYLLYRLWLRQATLRIAARMAERERIARTLHDTFLQSVQGLVLGFQTAMSALPEDSSTRARLERMLLLADRVIEEGRDEVQDLRSSAMSDGDLERGLTIVGEVLQESHQSVFSLRSEGAAVDLTEDASCEAYSIGREALMNAFRHAGAKSIQVTLGYGAGQFVLQVADDGKGIPAEILADGKRAGHWGLPGMMERAARIGATLTIDSPLIGTRVRLAVPAALAYVGQSRWKRWLRRLRRRG
ncbi:sensor histidine kinase [Duganella sp. CF517]|uniref:sensor histidine kinase n=1 Tax=Duganella sp. CF517 TaxID=1881038 RepID=UPI0011603169|nr:sensor histidine kinase [Duganella sp. CF517]